jgi:RNA polymerase sigma-70 factor (ECF subfamily)
MTDLSPASVTTEQLLAHADWVHRLARSLVRDPNLADDLAQETCLAAWSRGPGDGDLRGWLATVLRNGIRESVRHSLRRARRERVAARPESAPSSDDVVQRLTLHKDLAEAVHRLGEPYRTAIVLRFFESMPPRRIAARLAVPVATVRTRIARGLALLRERLDRQWAGGQRGGLAALLPFARPSRALDVSLAGVLCVSTKLKILAVAVVAVSAFALSWPWSADASVADPSLPAVPSPATETRDAAAGKAAPAGPRADRVPVVAPPGEPRAGTPVATMRVRGRVLDVEAVPRPGMTVVLRGAGTGDEALGSAVSGPGGAFELESERASGEVVVRSERHTTVLSGRVSPETPEGERIVVVADRLELGGRVTDSAGQPLPRASVRVALPDDFRSRFGDVLDFSASAEWLCATAADGRFALAVASVRGASLRVDLDGFRPWLAPLPDGPRHHLDIVLERPRASPGSIRGQVIDRAGALVAGARVALGMASTVTDERGGFTLEPGPDGGAREIVALQRGYLPARFARPDDGAPWPDFVLLQLGDATLTIEGRVASADGAPIGGVRVFVTDPSVFALVDGRAAATESLLAGGVTRSEMERRIAEAGPGADVGAIVDSTPTMQWCWTTSGADGRFTVAGLLPRAYRLRALRNDTLEMVDTGPVPAGQRGVELVFAADATLTNVTGRVVSLGGRPVSGVGIRVMADPFRFEVPGRGASTNHAMAQSTVSGPDGRFELGGVPRRAAYLRLDGDGILPREFGRGVDGGLEALGAGRADGIEIAVTQRCHFKIDATGSPGLADAARVLDAADETVVVHVFLGGGRRSTDEVELHGDVTDVLAVSESATTLVLTKAGAEVRRLPLTLLPGEVVVVRP